VYTLICCLQFEALLYDCSDTTVLSLLFPSTCFLLHCYYISHPFLLFDIPKAGSVASTRLFWLAGISSDDSDGIDLSLGSDGIKDGSLLVSDGIDEAQLTRMASKMALMTQMALARLS
jgi:hypothetical protein